METQKKKEQFSEPREAINQTINFCIEHHILEDILRKNRGEVMGSILETYDKKKYENTIRKEGIEIGYKSGYDSGCARAIHSMISLGIPKETILTMYSVEEYEKAKETIK